MTKVLLDNSVLHFLPKEIDGKQLMIIDSLRFTLEMIDFNYEELIKCLENIITKKEKKIHYKVFNYAWSIIDNSHRFVRLYKCLKPSEDSLIERLSYLDKFRNAIQHVDKNLEQSHVKMLDNRRPIYGAIKWFVSDFEKNKKYSAILTSGIFNVKQLKPIVHSGLNYQNMINEITLETDTLIKVMKMKLILVI